MGMSIDEAIEDLHAIQAYYNDDTQDGYIGFAKEDNESVDVAIDTMRKYQQLQADYEARLKADMVAMLEDLDLKIDEMYEPQFSKEGMDGFYWAQGLFKDLVQEKINTLKGEE